MFGDLIYYNKNMIEQYSALISGESIGVNDSEKIINNKKVNYLLECSEFEKLLQQRDDYFDYVDTDQDVLIKDVRISSIIRVTGEIYVPEQFDIIQLIDEYKPQLLSELDYKDKEEQELWNSILKNTKMRIPIYCELGESCDYWLGIGKAIPDNLLIEYNELEDYEGKEVTIISTYEQYLRNIEVHQTHVGYFSIDKNGRKVDSSTKRGSEESNDISAYDLILKARKGCCLSAICSF